MSEPEATASVPPKISKTGMEPLKHFVQKWTPVISGKKSSLLRKGNITKETFESGWYSCRVGPCATDADVKDLMIQDQIKKHLKKDHEIDFDTLSSHNARLFQMMVVHQETERGPDKTSVVPLLLKLTKEYEDTDDSCMVCLLDQCNKHFRLNQDLTDKKPKHQFDFGEMKQHQWDVHRTGKWRKYTWLRLNIIYKPEDTIWIRQEAFPPQAKPVEELGSSDMDISPEDSSETKSSEKRRRSISPKVYEEKDPPKSSYAGSKRTKIEERPTGLQIPTRLEFPTNVLPVEKSDVRQKASVPQHARPKPSSTIVKPIEVEKPTDSSSTKSVQRPKSGEWKQFTRPEFLEVPLPPSTEPKPKDKPMDESKLAPPKISPQKPAVTLKCRSCNCEHQILADCRCHGQAVSSNNFICGYCPTSKGPEVSTGDMQSSMQATEKLTTCRLCREKTGDLKNHLKRKHYLEIGKCYECILCNDRFVNVNELKSHKDKYCPYRK